MWRNTSQEKDACIGTLSHKDGVSSVAVGATRIVSGSGNSIFVYDAESQELLEELQGTSNATSVDIWDGGKDGGKHTNQSMSLIVAGYEDGTIKVWDADSFNLLETRQGEAMAFSEKAEGVVRDGATVRMKDGGGAFYAPSPIPCLAVSWPRIAAGAQSGELYHLEVRAREAHPQLPALAVHAQSTSMLARGQGWDGE
jgi:hypothetical protein